MWGIIIISPIMAGGQTNSQHNPCAWRSCESCRSSPFDGILSPLLFRTTSTQLSQLYRLTSALLSSGLRCLTKFIWVISVTTTSGLSHFWDYSSKHCPTFQMPFVDRLFLCFRWLQIWKPAKWRGWVQRFFQLKVQMVWHLSSTNKTMIKLMCAKVAYFLIFFHFAGGEGHRVFWPSQRSMTPPKIVKCYYKSSVQIFASSLHVFAFTYVLEYDRAAVCLLVAFLSSLVTEGETSFGDSLSCSRFLLPLPRRGKSKK